MDLDDSDSDYNNKRLSPEEFAYVIERTSLISVDVLLFNTEGRILLGRRIHEPAKNSWFTLGGRVYKNESLEDAIRRILSAEVAVPTRDISLFTSKLHGVYRHKYETNFLEKSKKFGTDYVNFAYSLHVAECYETEHVRSLEELKGIGDLDKDEQHCAFRWFSIEDIMKDNNVHPYVKCYFHPAAFNRIV